jgi:hypothetical protein
VRPDGLRNNLCSSINAIFEGTLICLEQQRLQLDMLNSGENTAFHPATIPARNVLSLSGGDKARSFAK